MSSSIQMANGTSQHDNIEGKFKLLWSLRKYLILLGTIAVGVTYNAGLTPPGGFWALSKDNHQAGNPVLPVGFFQRYEVFFYCNATTFAASLILIILLVSKNTTRHVLWLRSMQFTMILDLFSLMGAYAAGSCRALKSSIYVWILVFAVFMYVGIHVLVFMRVIPEKLKEMVQKTFVQIAPTWCAHDKQGDKCQDKDVEDARKFILILVAFTATVTYQAGLSPPGGFWAENEYDPLSKLPPAFPPYKHRPATSVLRSNYLHRYKVFVSCNSTSFVASLVTVILLLSTELGWHGIRSKAVIICVVADLLCLIGAYAAGCCRDVATSFYVMFITMIVLICFVLLVGIFVYEPVAIWLENFKKESLRCVSTLGQVLSSSRSNRFSNGDHNHETEIVGINNGTEPVANGHTHSNLEAPIQNANGNPIEEHLNKTRKNLLLLAILAVSLTYQSGLNPPGGFWSGNEFHRADGDDILEEYHHSASDRILEDTHHSRFIAFFYLNAVAFVASIVLIILLLNKTMIMKVTKRCALQVFMIVNLLCLTGAFVMGSCREANKSIYISVLVCLVLSYVLVHVLVAIHVIPQDWRRYISEKLKDFLCRLVSPASSESPQNWTEDIKELGRRRNLLLTLSILAATVTYQAGMNPPGGVWSDNKDVSGKPGNPILQDTHPKRYDVFYYSNSLSFVSSVVITILLVNKESCEHGIKSYALRVCLVVGLVGLLIAYAAGSCRKAIQSIYLIIIAVAVLISIVIQVFLLSSTNNTIHRSWGQSILLRFYSTQDARQDSSSGPEDSTDPQEKKQRKRKKYLMLLAVLAASIAYQAGLNPPGGFWSDDTGHKAGDPILHDVNHRRYKTFFCCNAFSFMSSIVVIMLLLSKTIREKDVPLEVLHLIMLLDLLSLMTAFAVGSCRKFRTSVYVYGLVVCVVIYLLLVTVLSSGIAKYLRSRRRNVISSQDHPEHASRANTPTLGHHV